jgi:hypothetical protein
MSELERSASKPKRSPWLRRGRLELIACAIIAAGFLMMLQPFALILFTWSFVTTLFGTVMFTIVSKFPE